MGWTSDLAADLFQIQVNEKDKEQLHTLIIDFFAASFAGYKQNRAFNEAVEKAMKYLEGAYSLVIMSAQKLICVRDPYGFRPLCYGRTADGTYIVASESCALRAVGAKLIRDINPGEIMMFYDGQVKSIQTNISDEVFLQDKDVKSINNSNRTSTVKNTLNCDGKKICVFDYIANLFFKNVIFKIIKVFINFSIIF